MQLSRRDVFLGSAALGVTLAACGRAGASENFPLKLSDAEWKKRLSPAAYYVLREEGTERAFTSPLNKEHRKGIFVCAGCALPVFSSATKFDSGTGWPSFWSPLAGVSSGSGRSFDLAGVEVHCKRCGGHLGHVFNDGPKPTGKRYCINGVALAFKPA